MIPPHLGHQGGLDLFRNDYKKGSAQSTHYPPKTENSRFPARSSDLLGPVFGLGSPHSAGCTKNQPRRPILARFRIPAEKSKS